MLSKLMKMDHIMKEKKGMVLGMEGVNFFMGMEDHFKENGKMVTWMDMVSFIILLSKKHMKENGMMTNLMGKVLCIMKDLKNYMDSLITKILMN